MSEEKTVTFHDLTKLFQTTGHVYTPDFSLSQLFTLHRFCIHLAIEPLRAEVEQRISASKAQGKSTSEEIELGMDLATLEVSFAVDSAVSGLYQIEMEPEKAARVRRLYGFDTAEEKGIRPKRVGGLLCLGHSNLPTSAFYARWHYGEAPRDFILRFEHPFDFDMDEYKS